MATACVSPIQALVVRFTRLDICGAPVTGVGSSQVVLDAFTEIANAPNYEEGQRFLLRRADGAPCVNQKGNGFLNWIDQTITLCTLNPDATVLVTGDRLISDGVTGTGVAFSDALLTEHYSVEVWQPVAGQACDTEGQQLFVYWAFPNCSDAQIETFTFQNDSFTFGWKQRTFVASPLWTIGDEWLGDAAAWGEDEHFAFNITTTAPPTAACAATTI